MVKFQYYAPTKILFGQSEEERAGDVVKEFGYKRVLVHYGGDFILTSGLLDRVTASLEKSRVEYFILDGVEPDPRLSLVRKGVAFGLENKADMILAIGGGSAIDSSKAIALGMSNDCDVWEFYSGKRRAENCMPVGVILTTAATGSEMSDGSVITDEGNQQKRTYSDDLIRPTFAILNPELMYTLPVYHMACGIVDIMMHTMERYFTMDERLEITDVLSESLIRTVMESGKEVLSKPRDFNALSEIMWASSLSHNGLTGPAGKGDWATHLIGRDLGGLFHITHGAGLSAIWGSWARYVSEDNPQRFVKFADRIFGITDRDTGKAVLKGIAAMEQYYKDIGMPTSIGQAGLELTDEQITQIADMCTDSGKKAIGNYKRLNRQDIIAILKAAR